jgi:hypothetical protein
VEPSTLQASHFAYLLLHPEDAGTTALHGATLQEPVPSRCALNRNAGHTTKPRTDGAGDCVREA